MSEERSAAHAYWHANKRLIYILLGIWAFVSFGCAILFAPFLNQFYIGQLPMGFWFAQQGSIYVFVILIFVYTWRMKKIERQFDMDDSNAEQESQ